jgi:hypothetical protein
MEGNPHEAASGIFNARERLYGAMMDLMGQGNLPAAYRAVREAQGFLEAVDHELLSLARVNGVAGDLAALEGEDEGSGPSRCPVCGSDDPAEPLLMPAEPFAPPVGCTHPWHQPLDPAGRARREGMCRDGRTCSLHCGTGPCSRSCQSCGRLAWTDSAPCPACPDRGTTYTPAPPPDPDRRPGTVLLSNASLNGYDPGTADLTSIPAVDIGVERVPAGLLPSGRGKGVRLTHIPTGTVAISSCYGSLRANMQTALERLAQHQNVVRYMVNSRCTHAAGCPVHRDAGGLHDDMGREADLLPVHRIPGDKRDPR